MKTKTNVWLVRQYCFMIHSPNLFDWSSVFSTKEDAKDLFDYYAYLYRMQVKSLERATIDEDDNQLCVMIDGDPAVLLGYYEQQIDEDVDSGCVLIGRLIESLESHKQSL